MRIHPVCHVSLSEPAASYAFESHKQPKPLPIIVNEHEEREVELILDARTYYPKS
jgi:hypothetical protein